MDDDVWVPVTFDHCDHVRGPFFHGTRAALQVSELDSWEGHPPEVFQAMLGAIARLREQGLDVIED